MSERIPRRLHLCSERLLRVAVFLAVAMLGVFAAPARALSQTTVTAHTTSLDGTWQGKLQAGRELRTVLQISKADGGGWRLMFYSIDQGPQGFPATAIVLQGATLKFSIGGIDGSYDGQLSADGNSITGTWRQGPTPLPLNFQRATAETAWEIPKPAPQRRPMDPSASPGVEVATIKPSTPGTPGSGIFIREGRITTLNTTLSALIAWAYEVHPRQIVGGPASLEAEKFDIVAQPDGEGQPNYRQWKVIVQKLLTERFQLTFHHDQKELSAYALTVGRSGPKLTESAGDPNAQPGLFFRGPGVWPGSNVSMKDFCVFMQRTVLDRPVVNQTGLTGRYDFLLKWTPDESQSVNTGWKIPPPGDNAEALPDLFTAIQQQLGLKLEATKAPVDILVIDHVERPSEN